MGSVKVFEKFSYLLYPETMIALGAILIIIALIQTPLFGYTTIADPYAKLFEEPMDKMSFGLILASVGIVVLAFWNKYKIARKKLGLFCLSFAFSMRTFWEINWVTSAYMSSLYTYYSLTNKISPIYPGPAWPALDYIGTTPFYMNFILPVFALSTVACVFLILSVLFDYKKK